MIIRAPLFACALVFSTLLFTGGRKPLAFLGRMIKFKVLLLSPVKGSRSPDFGSLMNSGGSVLGALDAFNDGFDAVVLVIAILIVCFGICRSDAGMMIP